MTYLKLAEKKQEWNSSMVAGENTNNGKLPYCHRNFKGFRYENFPTQDIKFINVSAALLLILSPFLYRFCE